MSDDLHIPYLDYEVDDEALAETVRRVYEQGDSLKLQAITALLLVSIFERLGRIDREIRHGV
jgi:hypothetical protein